MPRRPPSRARFALRDDGSTLIAGARSCASREQFAGGGAGFPRIWCGIFPHIFADRALIDTKRLRRLPPTHTAVDERLRRLLPLGDGEAEIFRRR